MQYIGYLRRNANELPDSSFDGYDFWLRKLTHFNGNFIEAEMVRAFIESGEYRARFGREVPEPIDSTTWGVDRVSTPVRSIRRKDRRFSLVD
jgi:hypothetical protein